MAELEIHGYLRRGNAFTARARQTRRLAARTEFLDLAFRSFQTALDKVDMVPNGTQRLKPGILREIASLMIQRGRQDGCLEEAETLARQAAAAYRHLAVVDDPLLYYLCQVTLARTLLAQGKFANAILVLQEARQAEAYARERGWVAPGPLHRLMLLRTEAWSSLERAKTAGRNSGERKQFAEEWHQKIWESLDLARTAGLTDQEDKIEQTIRTVDREFRPLVTDPPTFDQK